eukprot:scaffold438_cov250-Pinguiococcus_pyrenoidosus.AAC.12
MDVASTCAIFVTRKKLTVAEESPRSDLSPEGRRSPLRGTWPSCGSSPAARKRALTARSPSSPCFGRPGRRWSAPRRGAASPRFPCALHVSRKRALGLLVPVSKARTYRSSALWHRRSNTCGFTNILDSRTLSRLWTAAVDARARARHRLPRPAHEEGATDVWTVRRSPVTGARGMKAHAAWAFR